MIDRKIYKLVLNEKPSFPSALLAIQHHIKMSIAYAELFLDDEEADLLVKSLGQVNISPLGKKTYPAPIKKEVQTIQTSLDTSLFPKDETESVPESVPESNIISEEEITPALKYNTVVIPESTNVKEEEVFTIQKALPIESTMLSSRAKIVLVRAGLLTLGDLIGLTSQDLRDIKGCGEDTVLDIIRVMKKFYSVETKIVTKHPAEKGPKKLGPRGPYKKKYPLDDPDTNS